MSFSFHPRRWLPFVVVIAAGIAATLFATGAWSPFGNRRANSATPSASSTSGESPASPDAVPVTVVPAATRSVQRWVPMVGTLNGFEELTISPKVEGRVVRVSCDIGDSVRPGDVLLEIDDTDYRLAVAEARRAVELELARLGLKTLPKDAVNLDELPTVVRAKAVENNARLKFNRVSALRDRGASTEEDYQQVAADFQVAKAIRDQAAMEAQATLAAARHKQAMLESAQQRLADTKVIAPDLSESRRPATAKAPSKVKLTSAIDAPSPTKKVDWPVYMVSQRLVSEGEMIRAAPLMPAFRLVIDQPLKLMARLPERYVGDLKVGQNVTLHVEAFPKEIFTGTVSRVNPTVDRTSRSFQVEVHVPNDDRRLKAGSFVKAEVSTRTDTNAVLVPEESIVNFAGIIKVFIVQQDKAHAVPVKLGVRQTEERSGGRPRVWVEVIGELPAGSAVVTSGQTRLAEGTLVRIRAAEEEK